MASGCANTQRQLFTSSSAAGELSKETNRQTTGKQTLACRPSGSLSLSHTHTNTHIWKSWSEILRFSLGLELVASRALLPSARLKLRSPIL